MRTAVRATVICATALFFLTPGTAFAQATGGIAGIVADESGAVMPGVTIEVTNAATGQTRSVTTNADGYYSVPQVQPGTYAVKATLSGFKAVTRSGIPVTV